MSEATATRTNRAYEVLQEHVEEIRSTDQWKAALRLRSRLHNYSWHNLMLISLQCPEARMIAGYRKWQELGRQVRKGEKSIAILAPLTKKVEDENGEKQTKIYGFRAVSVFDVSQTDGDALPELPRPEPLTGGDPKRITAQWNELAAHVTDTLGVSITYGDQGELKGAGGYYNPANNEICIDVDAEPIEQLTTLVHETAHALLHGKADLSDDRRLIEVEAETVSYLVCDALGIDTGCFSFAYVAGWAGETDALLKAGHRACKAADDLVATLTTPEGVAS